MNPEAAFDPFVATALERIAPPAAIDADEMLARARAARSVTSGSAWSLQRFVLVAAVALLLLAGAAYAAHTVGLLPWLRTSDRTSAAFTVDVARRYHGPAPNTIVCAHLDKPEFTCRETFSHTAKDAYYAPSRIRAPYVITRSRLADLLRQGARLRFVQRSELPQLLRDARDAPNDFFVNLATLQSIRIFQAGPVKIGSVTVVPPKDIPFWIVCTDHDGPTLQCGPLSLAQGVPVGSPTYLLFPSLDWPRAIGKPGSDIRPPGLIEHIWSRRLRPSETRLLKALHLEPAPRP